jgi:hypothetical protein
VREIREIVESAKRRLGDSGRRTILFLDEIHRFSKSQQDVLLGDVERGDGDSRRCDHRKSLLRRQLGLGKPLDRVHLPAAQ